MSRRSFLEKSVMATAGALGSSVVVPPGFSAESNPRLSAGPFQLSDSGSVYDYSGTTFQQKLESALTAGGRIVVPPGAYGLEPFKISTPRALILEAEGAVFQPLLPGKILDFGNTSAKVVGATFDMKGEKNAKQTVAMSFDGAEYIDVRQVTFLDGAFGVFLNQVGHVNVESCLGERAALWHFYLRGCKSAFFLYNRSFAGNFDGLKIACVEKKDGGNIRNDNIFFHGNFTSGNRRDGIDVATNDGECWIFSNNISYNDLLRGIDAKIVYQSEGGVSDITIVDNICARFGVDGDITAYNVQSEVQGKFIERPLVARNKIITDGKSSLASAVRFQNVEDAICESNIVQGYYYGVRLTGAVKTVTVSQNKITKCAVGIQSQPYSEGGVPEGIRISKNHVDCIGHASGVSGNAIKLDGASQTEIDENEFIVSAENYSIAAENVKLAASDTRVGRNFRGWVQKAPIKTRAVYGDCWKTINPDIGYPMEWICIKQTASTGLKDLLGINQVGFRRVSGDPRGSVEPIWIGERVLDLSTHRWWSSFGESPNDWA